MSALLVKKPDLPLFLRFDPTFLLHIFLHARPNGPQHSRKHHDENRIFLKFPEEYHGDHEDHHQTPVGVGKGDGAAAAPKGGDENGDSGGGDHGHHGGTEGTQDSLEHSHVPVFEVELREQSGGRAFEPSAYEPSI